MNISWDFKKYCMLPLPVEVFGHIGSFLNKKDHYCLSVSNTLLWSNLPIYSPPICFTEHQKRFYLSLFSLINDSDIRLIWLHALPSSKRTYPLIVLISHLAMKGRKIYIVCECHNLSKWLRLLKLLLKSSPRQESEGIYNFRNHIILTSSMAAWKNTNNKQDYLFVSLSPLDYYKRKVKTIAILPGLTFVLHIPNEPGEEKLVKISLVPPPRYSQNIILEPNLFSLIDKLMEKYDEITVLGGLKSYVGRFRAHVEREGKYNVLIRDEPSIGTGKNVRIYNGRYLMDHDISISGVVLIRSWIDNEPFGGKYVIHDGIYRALFSSSRISHVYWHLGDGGFNITKVISYMYEKFVQQISFLLSLRYDINNIGDIHSFIDIIERIPNDNTLRKIFHLENRIFSWNLYDALDIVCTTELRQYSFVKSMLLEEKDRY